MQTESELNIFLVDDDPFSLALQEKALKSLGHQQPQLFTSGRDCLSNLNHVPDLIFLDYQMEDLDGFEVLKKIKRHNPDIYVIILSGQKNMQSAVDSLKFGAFDYIIKGPDMIDRMADGIQRIIEIQKILSSKKPNIIRKFFPFL